MTWKPLLIASIFWRAGRFLATVLAHDHRKELHVTAAGAYEHVSAISRPCSSEAGIVIRLSVANAAGVIKHLEARDPTDVVLTSAAGLLVIAAGLADEQSGRDRTCGLGIAAVRGCRCDLATAASVRGLAVGTVCRLHRPEGGGTSVPFIAQLFERLGIAGEMSERGVLSKPKDVVRAVASGGDARPDAGDRADRREGRVAGRLPSNLQVVSVYSAPF